jgi:hypothetical protein
MYLGWTLESENNCEVTTGVNGFLVTVVLYRAIDEH